MKQLEKAASSLRLFLYYCATYASKNVAVRRAKNAAATDPASAPQRGWYRGSGYQPQGFQGRNHSGHTRDRYQRKARHLRQRGGSRADHINPE